MSAYLANPTCDWCTRHAVELCDRCGVPLCDVCPCRCLPDAADMALVGLDLPTVETQR